MEVKRCKSEAAALDEKLEREIQAYERCLPFGMSLPLIDKGERCTSRREKDCRCTGAAARKR